MQLSPADTPDTGVSAGDNRTVADEWRAALTAEWDRRWPGTRPIGHELRGWMADRWVRFHSLPHSERHATTSREGGEILHRHQVVLRELSGGVRDAEIVVVTAGWSAEPRPPRPSSVARQLRVGREIRPRGGAWWRSIGPPRRLLRLSITGERSPDTPSGWADRR